MIILIDDLTNWITYKPLSDSGFGFDVKRGAYAIHYIEMTTHILQLRMAAEINHCATIPPSHLLTLWKAAYLTSTISPDKQML